VNPNLLLAILLLVVVRVLGLRLGGTVETSVPWCPRAVAGFLAHTRFRQRAATGGPRLVPRRLHLPLSSDIRTASESPMVIAC
jgi:hypothetical protein